MDNATWSAELSDHVEISEGPKFIGTKKLHHEREKTNYKGNNVPVVEENGYRTLFSGSNEPNEIETLEEFFLKTDNQKDISLNGWNFQAVDFSLMSLEKWNMYNWEGAVFMGCVFPEGITPKKLRKKQCQVWENPTNVPFTTFRAYMYIQEEMEKCDAIIGKFYLENKRNFSVRMAESMHDFSMRDALFDFLEGKAPVGIMGSHTLKRGSDSYGHLVHLARKLARAGFLVVTGGGSGAMEAANLGAYLAEKTEEEVEEALHIIRSGNEGQEFEFLHPVPANNVVKRFGYPTHMPSLGIPTWRYSNEPFNRFATYHAKFFSNALREDGIIHICRAGIVFGQGGPGTRQEVFQAACVNHEQLDPINQCPMAFLDSDFWKNNGVWDVISNTSKGQPFHDDLLLTDDIDHIVNLFVAHAKRKRLCLTNNFDIWKEKYWIK